MPRKTALETAEAELSAFGFAMPETTLGSGWATTRVLKVKDKMFFIFGDRRKRPVNSP